jgi:hypothetical protein
MTGSLEAIAYCGRAKKWPCRFVNYQADTCYKSSILNTFQNLILTPLNVTSKKDFFKLTGGVTLYRPYTLDQPKEWRYPIANEGLVLLAWRCRFKNADNL